MMFRSSFKVLEAGTSSLLQADKAMSATLTMVRSVILFIIVIFFIIYQFCSSLNGLLKLGSKPLAQMTPSILRLRISQSGEE